ncbi:MAG: DHH family phosphoesterase [Planctomycetota bacterium]
MSPPDAIEQARYETNTSPAGLVAWIRDADRLLIVTHSRPDGDAVGSSLAIARAVQQAGGSAALAYAGELPGWMDSILAGTPWQHLDRGEPPPPFDRALVCDTGAWNQLEPYKPWLAGKADRIAVLDHHRSGSADAADLRLVDAEAAATCELAAGACVDLLGLASASQLPTEIAEPLLLGLGTDTGWFRHPSVTPGVLRLAADLIEAGGDHATLVKKTMLSDPPNRARLMARALATLTLHEAEGLATIKVTAADLRETGSSVGMTSGFADPALGVQGISAAAVLTELPKGQGGPGVVKISLRSKVDGPDVAKMAGAFGGGGHIHAAGARSDKSLAEVEAALLELVRAVRDDAATGRG